MDAPRNNKLLGLVEQSRRQIDNKGGVQVSGTTISWPDNGWYEVQSASSFNTISEGGNSATLPHGEYTLINHTTGERFENVVVPQPGDQNANTGNSVGPDMAPLLDDSMARSRLNPLGASDPLSNIRNPDIEIINPGRPRGGDDQFGTIDTTDFVGMSILQNGENSPQPPASTRTDPNLNTEGDTEETTTVSTRDTTSTNSPVTNTTTRTDTRGNVTETQTVTTPTGTTVGTSGNNGVTTSNANRNSESDTDNGPGGGGVSSSQSAADAGFGTSAGGEFG